MTVWIQLYFAAGKQWAVVMSRCNEYKDQVIELDFLYPSEGIHRRWDEGEYCTSIACQHCSATLDKNFTSVMETELGSFGCWGARPC